MKFIGLLPVKTYLCSVGGSDCALVGIHRKEPTGRHSVVTGSQVEQPSDTVELFTTEQVVVRSRAGVGDFVAESILAAPGRRVSRGVGQESGVPMTIVAVETRRPGAANELIFTDALQAVSIGACHCSVDQFIHYLRVSSWIERVRQVLRRDSARRFRYSVPIAVVDNSDRSSGEHTVLEVVGGGDSCRRSCITVGVERIPADSVVGIIRKRPAWNAV